MRLDMGIAAVIIMATTASVSAGQQQADDRAYFKALHKQDSGACYSIQDADKRNLCRAEVARDSSICYAVIDPDVRELCRVRLTGQ